MKSKWSKRLPKTEGWYWVRYSGKNGVVTCPAEVVFFKLTKSLGSKDELAVKSARNDFFTRDTLGDLKFGPPIPLDTPLNLTEEYGNRLSKIKFYAKGRLGTRMLSGINEGDMRNIIDMCFGWKPGTNKTVKLPIDK